MSDSGQLRLRFRRANTMPFLPDTASELIDLIDDGQASSEKLAQIIKRDPAFVAEFCRYAKISLGADAGDLDLKAIVMRLGLRAVRALATGIAAKNVIPDSPAFNNAARMRLARSAIATGYFAKYLYARWQKLHPNSSDGLAPEEVFTVGLVSKVGTGMLAMVAPDCFARSSAYAQKAGLTISSAVAHLYKEDIDELTCEVFEAWELSDFTLQVLRNIKNPWEDETVYIPSACILYAQELTARAGLAFEEWGAHLETPPDVLLDIGMVDAEFMIVKKYIKSISEATIGADTSTKQVA
ncbi:MAG: HDOD domain-containing protein [Fimbriimonadaceae bacterium]|nr:MAG: HDOD domain-containing protein [Fimbriimonadaceae bacterium]